MIEDIRKILCATADKLRANKVEAEYKHIVSGSILLKHISDTLEASRVALKRRFDASPDHGLQEEQYRLWLSDPLALYGVENAKLAPGYRAPVANTIRK